MTNMATKKKSKSTKKNGGKTRLDLGDPPILVGGGGSAYLWVNLGQDERPVNPSLDNPGIGINPKAPKPNTRDAYACSRVREAFSKITFYDGVNPQPTILTIPMAGRNGWSISFE
jgi:hypothetical protein